MNSTPPPGIPPAPDWKLTHDFPDAHHDPGEANQAFGRCAELGGGPDAGPVNAAVEGQLQAWREGGREGESTGLTSALPGWRRAEAYLPL